MHDDEERTDLEILGNLADETLEGELADEELRGLLVPTDLAERDGTRPEAVRLLHTAGRSLSAQVIEWLRIEGKSTRRLTAAVLRAWDLAASCLRGALPPVDLRAVCLVRAIADVTLWW